MSIAVKYLLHFKHLTRQLTKHYSNGLHNRKGKEKKDDLYSAFILRIISKRSGMDQQDHTVLPANTPCLPFLRRIDWRSPPVRSKVADNQLQLTDCRFADFRFNSLHYMKLATLMALNALSNVSYGGAALSVDGAAPLTELAETGLEKP